MFTMLQTLDGGEVRILVLKCGDRIGLYTQNGTITRSMPFDNPSFPHKLDTVL